MHKKNPIKLKLKKHQGVHLIVCDCLSAILLERLRRIFGCFVSCWSSSGLLAVWVCFALSASLPLSACDAAAFARLTALGPPRPGFELSASFCCPAAALGALSTVDFEGDRWGLFPLLLASLPAVFLPAGRSVFGATGLTTSLLSIYLKGWIVSLDIGAKMKFIGWSQAMLLPLFGLV